MRIRATFPFSCWVTGPSADALSPTFHFLSRGWTITASLVGEHPLELPEPGDQAPWFRRVHNLTVEIDEAESGLVTRVVASVESGRIIGLIKPAESIVQVIRNFDWRIIFREFKASDVYGDHWLDLLSVETSPDGATWTRVGQPPNDLGELLARRSLLRREYLGEFKIANLTEVQEAIEDNLTAGPERAFFANAVEHLRRGDLRVAVVESIICLEILVGQLLPKLLEARSVPSDALTKEITLHPRVKMLLPLLLPAEAASVDLAAVLQNHLAKHDCPSVRLSAGWCS